MSELRKPESIRFMTTHWTEVLAARNDSESANCALRVLCDRYYAPVFAFILAYTQRDQDARDLTHSFFLKLLESSGLDQVSANRGRFRSYLLGAVKHFIAEDRIKMAAMKRGGQTTTIPFKEDSSDLKSQEFPPDAFFDRQWALAVLEQALSQLEGEVTAAANSIKDDSHAVWHALKPWLVGEPTEQSQQQIADRLGTSREQVKVKLHRWRKRFREIVKSLIADTVESNQSVGAELDYLILALSFKNA